MAAAFISFAVATALACVASASFTSNITAQVVPPMFFGDFRADAFDGR